MGTIANTYVIETGHDKPVVLLNLYRQFDGYPSVHGQELAAFLSGIRLCNGLSFGENSGIANGAGCLAAQLVAHFKTDAGGFYIEAPRLRYENDYTYIIRVNTFSPSDGIKIEVREWNKKVFEGRLRPSMLSRLRR